MIFENKSSKNNIQFRSNNSLEKCFTFQKHYVAVFSFQLSILLHTFIIYVSFFKLISSKILHFYCFFGQIFYQKSTWHLSYEFMFVIPCPFFSWKCLWSKISFFFFSIFILCYRFCAALCIRGEIAVFIYCVYCKSSQTPQRQLQDAFYQDNFLTWIF